MSADDRDHLIGEGVEWRLVAFDRIVLERVQRALMRVALKDDILLVEIGTLFRVQLLERF